MKKIKMFQAALIAVSLIFTVSKAQAQATDSDYAAFVKNVDSYCAIVTGSNRGQGLGWAKHFLEEGSSVIATCRKPADASELNALVKKYGSKILIEQLDVTNEDHQRNLGEQLTKHGVKIDMAISNAGVTVIEEFGQWTKKGFEFNIGVNTIGCALFAQAISPSLKNGAKLIHLSSGAGTTGGQKRINSLDAYGVSKAGLNHLTKRLALKLADREIIVISVTPGGVLTDMNPAGKLSVEKAVSIMSATFDGLTIEDTGTFITNTGKPMSW